MKLPKVTRTKKSSKPKDPGAFPVSHYSYSSLVKFATNPILFKIQYVNKDQLDTTVGISAVLGRALHTALDVYYGGNEEVSITNEEEAIEFGLKAGMQEIECYNEGFIEFSKTISNKQKAYDYFAFAFNSYVLFKPAETSGEEVINTELKLEHMIDVEWKGQKLTLPVKLKGYLDKLVYEDGKLKIKDYKMAYNFSNPDKIDGSKIIQAVTYYLLVYAETGERPYSMSYEEVKYTKNRDGSPQVREYEIIFEENELYFDFFFRLYEDVTKALNGEMVYVPNLHAIFDNEVSLIAYIHRLDVSEEQAKLMKKHRVDNLTDLLKRKIATAGNMRRLLKTLDKKFVSAKTLNYEKMKNEEKIQTKLMEHGMMVQFFKKIEGATVDLYQYTPSIGLKMSRLKSYVQDVEQVLGVLGVRILAPIPNTTLVGFEVPRRKRTFPVMPKKDGFNIAIGESLNGKPRRYDIRKAPHLLVAGASGSGKSVFLGSVIEQLSSISKADLHLFDPKMVELASYAKNANEYKTEPDDINASLSSLIRTMEARYKKFAVAGVKNIQQYNGSMRYKFVVIDEFGDLPKKGIHDKILKLAQKARAAGIHLIIATQRPSTKIITGDIKTNFPTKVAFRTAKAIDSSVIMDTTGAEKLTGKGDMLFSNDEGIERLQGYLT